MSNGFLLDTLKFLPGKIIPALAGILLIPVLTHFLPREEYGRYSLAMTMLAMISAFFLTWPVSVNLRFYSISGFSALSGLTRSLLLLSVFFSGFLWSAMAGGMGKFSPVFDYISTGLVWILSFAIYEYYVGWLRIIQRPLLYSAMQIWRGLSVLAFSYIILSMGFSEAHFAILCSAASMLLPAIMLPHIVAAAVRGGAVIPQQPLSIWDILKYGVPYSFSNLVIIGLSVFDRIIVENYLGSAMLAVYAAHYDIAEKTIFFLNSTLLLSSSVIGYKLFDSHGDSRAVAFIEKILDGYIILLLPILMGLVVLAERISRILFPADYINGWPILSIVSLAGVFVGIMHRYALVLGFHKRSDLILACAAVALSVNVLLCIILIPLHGLIGAAFATLGAYFAWLIAVRVAVASYVYPRFPWKILFRAGFAIMIPLAILYSFVVLNVINHSLLLGFSYFLCVCLYILLLHVFRAVSLVGVFRKLTSGRHVGK